MLSRIIALFDKIRGKNPKYEAAIRAWRRGKELPFDDYPRNLWPAPYYRLVSAEKVLGKCPFCAEKLLWEEEKGVFPEFFNCFAEGCGMEGRHPLYCH